MVLKNDILLRAAKGEMVERPPVWLMRQAGRILPQYRAIRASVPGFKELVYAPELAAEVTIQPVDELSVDAAILFSDILVIPEAMGLDYELIEKLGPRFPKTILPESDLNQLLTGDAAAERLGYVYEAIRITRSALNGRVPLIGFSGAPWTLFCYMVEGGGSKTFSKAKRMLYRHPEFSHRLLQLITDAVIAYLKMKVKAGVDLVQIFDSWAGGLSPESYKHFSLPYITQIVQAVEGVPKTVFAKDAWYGLSWFSETGCEVIGLDWTVSPAYSRQELGPRQVVQGNLDPCILYASHQEIRENTLKMLKAFGRHHIANLGHGVYPDTPLDGVKCFVETVQQFDYQKHLI